ncbi:hypothetical protein CsSME_00002796 [Camellia sinensis var. sinensis]
MAKFAQDLKDRFLRLVEAITSCKSAKEGFMEREKTIRKVNGEEPHLKTVQRAVKGPTKPPVTKGAHPQTGRYCFLWNYIVFICGLRPSPTVH